MQGGGAGGDSDTMPRLVQLRNRRLERFHFRTLHHPAASEHAPDSLGFLLVEKGTGKWYSLRHYSSPLR
jgi:hypothetical protein